MVHNSILLNPSDIRFPYPTSAHPCSTSHTARPQCVTASYRPTGSRDREPTRAPPGCRPAQRTRTMPRSTGTRSSSPNRRVIQNRHSSLSEHDYLQGECSYSRADSVRRFNVGRVIVLEYTPPCPGQPLNGPDEVHELERHPHALPRARQAVVHRRRRHRRQEGVRHLREHGAVRGVQPRQHLRRKEPGVLLKKLQQRW